MQYLQKWEHRWGYALDIIQYWTESLVTSHKSLRDSDQGIWIGGNRAQSESIEVVSFHRVPFVWIVLEVTMLVKKI